VCVWVGGLRNSYDVGVGGDDHESVEREDGDGAPGEGGAGNLRRRHPCARPEQRRPAAGGDGGAGDRGELRPERARRPRRRCAGAASRAELATGQHHRALLPQRQWRSHANPSGGGEEEESRHCRAGSEQEQRGGGGGEEAITSGWLTLCTSRS
jgi:hypothetical protein